MIETHLPTGCWIMVALIAAVTVWMCLTVLGAVVEYERCRLNLRREVKDLRQRYSLTSPGVVMTPDAGAGPDRKAA